MSDCMRKALKDAGKITITIEGSYDGNLKYCVHEEAFRLNGFERGKITKEALEAAEDPDELIRQEISAAVRRNHISQEARQAFCVADLGGKTVELKGFGDYDGRYRVKCTTQKDTGAQLIKMEGTEG